MIPVDTQGKPVYNEIRHSDNRSEQYCSYILDRISPDNFFAITGNRVDSHFTLPKIIWFKQHFTKIYKKTKYIIQSKDSIRSRLTGVHGVTDYSDASLTCAFNFKKKMWAKDMLCELGLDVNKFPQIRASHELAGTVSADVAHITGLKEGISVYLGGGDTACSTRGAGIVAKGKAQLCVGSSAWISVLEEKPLVDHKRRLQNFYGLDGYLCNVCGTVQSAAITVGVGSGLFQNYESGAQMISFSHSIEPNNETYTRYKKQYEKFCRLYHPFRDLCYIMKHT